MSTNLKGTLLDLQYCTVGWPGLSSVLSATLLGSAAWSSHCGLGPEIRLAHPGVGGHPDTCLWTVRQDHVPPHLDHKSWNREK